MVSFPVELVICLFLRDLKLIRFSTFYVVLKKPFFLESDQFTCCSYGLLCFLHQSAFNYTFVPSLNRSSSSILNLNLNVFVKCDIIGKLKLILNVAVSSFFVRLLAYLLSLSRLLLAFDWILGDVAFWGGPDHGFIWFHLFYLSALLFGNNWLHHLLFLNSKITNI